MAETPTTRHGLSKQDLGDTAWHVLLNATLDKLDSRLPWNYAGDPNGNVAGDYIGQPIYDSTNGVLYICTTAGTSSSAVWTQYQQDTDQVKVSSNDTTKGFLEDKLLAGTGLTLSTQNDGGNETRTIDHDFATQADAEGGTATTKPMNALRTKQAIDQFAGGALAQLDTVGSAEIGTGVVNSTHLASTSVIAGSYTAANITVDADGRLTAASNSGALTSVSQGDLNTSVWTAFSAYAGWVDQGIAGGGSYGFGLECYSSFSGNYYAIEVKIQTNNTDSTYTKRIYTNSPSAYQYVRERYITASPPINLGEGDCAGFLFIKISGNKILNTYLADVPPWLYNGKTKVTPDFITPDGRKFRYKRGSMLSSILNKQPCKHYKPIEQEVRDRVSARLPSGTPISLEKHAKLCKEIEQEILTNEAYEITHDIKNADMSDIPHPFSPPKAGEEILLVGLYSQTLYDLIHAQNLGEDIQDALHRGLIYPDNEYKTGIAPAGVRLVDLKIK